MKWKLLLIIIAILMIIAIIFGVKLFLNEKNIIDKNIGNKNIDSIIRQARSYDNYNNNLIGYEYLNLSGNITNEYNGKIIHIWNYNDDYFFNKTSGIQFTNHFDEYWTKNVFCGGIYEGSPWFCLDDTNNLFTWNISTDNINYVNYTGTRIDNIGNTQLKLEIIYHLNLYDENLSVIFKVTNLGTKKNQEITSNLGFSWINKDIKINNNFENDRVFINNSYYNLNEVSNLIFTNLQESRYLLTDGGFVSLEWDKNLNYNVKILNETGQYNSPVHLNINIGTLPIEQSKSTTIYWKDPTYTMTLNNVFTSSYSINLTRKVNFTMNIQADNKAGTWQIYMMANMTNGTQRKVDGTCGTNTAFKISNIFIDGNVCTSSDSSTGLLTCDVTSSTSATNETLEIEYCPNADYYEPYTFIGMNGTSSNAWSGFPKSLSGIYIGTYLTTFSNLVVNDSDVFIGHSVNHSITISNSPTQYLFSWNASGINCDTWQNSSWISTSNENTIAYNVSNISSSCLDKKIGWRFYGNNSAGVNASDIKTYDVNSYGWLNVSISKPDDNSYWNNGNTNLTLNSTVTCSGGTNSKCGIISAYARYNKTTSSPDTFINTTEDTPFYLKRGESSIICSNLTDSKDAHIYQGAGDSNYGGLTNLRLTSSGVDNYRELLSFSGNSSEIDYVINATLNLYYYSWSSSLPSGTQEISVYDTFDNWTESGVTWNNQPATKNLINTIIFPDNSTLPRWITYNVTQGYNFNNLSNISILIRFSEEGSPTSLTTLAYSKEYATTSLRPYLTVCYSKRDRGNNPIISPSLSYGNSYQFNWTLNVTSTIANQSYLLDTFFNSSYGSSNVQDNNTADKLIFLNFGGGGGGNSCTCPSANTNWTIAMTDYCNITSACNLGTGNLSFTGAGYCNISATVTSNKYGAFNLTNGAIIYLYKSGGIINLI